jgi:hypothetical protein
MAPDIKLKPILDAQKKHAQHSVAKFSTSPSNPGFPSTGMLQRIRVSPEQESSRLRRFLNTKAVVADIYGIKRRDVVVQGRLYGRG